MKKYANGTRNDGYVNRWFINHYGDFIYRGINIVILEKGKSYRMAYGLVLGHLVFFSWAVSQALKAISFDTNHPMASEEISLQLGISGALWAISMVFLVIGLIKFSFTKKTNVATPHKQQM